MPSLRPLMMVLASFLALASCSSLPQETPLASERIPVGWGPEDVILDDYFGAPRLLISCDDRREIPARFSGIISYDIETGTIDTLVRKEEPQNMSFHPLGIDLVQLDDKLFLYAISIDDEKGRHKVVKYQVDGNELYWIRNFESELFRSPNGISVHGMKGFFLSNDSYNRQAFGELAFRKKKSQLIYCTNEGEARIVQDKIAYGNGVIQAHGFLYQSALRGDVIYRYRVAEDGSLSDKQEWAHVAGPDNLSMDGEDILVACHLKPLAFVKHKKNAKKRSPSVIYRISTSEKLGKKVKPAVVYCNKGETISAGSTGLMYQGKLYITQVFEPFMLKVDLYLNK